MRRFTHRLTRPSALLARRLQHARPGSVLILVVALLVLMALIGTAWLSTARTDRYTAQQNSYNTQVELFVQAVVNMAQAVIADDVYGDGQYRPITGSAPPDYEHYDEPMRDTFLASRLPLGPSARPVWPFVSGSPAGNTFEAPYATDATGTQLPGTPPYRYPIDRFPASIDTDGTDDIAPTFIDVNNSDGTTTRFPALQISPAGGPAGNIYLAADADGDGIADSALFRIPGGTLAGVTYYGAFRVLDNNSAINASLAWEPNTDAAEPDQFSPVNINLHGLLTDVAPKTADRQMNGLNYRRFSEATTDDPTADAGNDTAPIVSTVPVTEAGTPRTDFEFVNAYDAVDKQLARRLGYAGYHVGVTGGRYAALPFGESMTMAYRFLLRNPLASRSLLENEFTIGYSTYDTARDTPYDLANGATEMTLWYDENFEGSAARPLRPVLVARNAVSNAVPRTVEAGAAHDPAADYQFGDIVTFADPGPPAQADRAYWAILTNGPSTMTLPGVVAPAGNPRSALVWAPLSWLSHPTRTSANTAGFGELWMAFFNTMNARPAITDAHQAPYPLGGLGAPLDTWPRARRQFRSPMRDPNVITGMEATPDAAVTSGSVEPVQLPPAEVMKLRSAIAAANAIDLRDADSDVTARRIFLRAAVAGAEVMVDVDVYGQEAQPFIAEIYVNNKNVPEGTNPANPRGYVAVQVYNPSSVDISLQGWNLAIADRRSEARTVLAGSPHVAPVNPYPVNNMQPGMVMLPITEFLGFGGPGQPPAPTLLAGETLILENYATPEDLAAWTTAPNGEINAALNRPAQTKLPLIGDYPGIPAPSRRVWVPNLHEVMRRPGNVQQTGGELYLLRPRRADGTLTSSVDPKYPYDERNSAAAGRDDRALALAELIPLDSFDFAEFSEADPLLTAPDGGPQFFSWHYARIMGAGANNRWKCTYAGRWDPTAPWDLTAVRPPPGSVFRQEGIREQRFDSTQGELEDLSINLTTDNGTATFHHPYQPIQLNNTNQPSDNRQTITPPNLFPFGGFARNADVLHVTFVGSYRMRLFGATAFLEMNPVTQDIVRAHDADTRYPGADYDNAAAGEPSDDGDEQIGRFCPIERSPRTGAPFLSDFMGTAVNQRYAWSIDLLDHIGAFSPQDDYLPDVDPARNDPGLIGTPPVAPPYEFKYPPATDFYPASPTAPQPVPNGGATDYTLANDGQEDAVGIEGLVNINTAPYEVLRAVPMLPIPADNNALADAIIDYRNTNGAFRSLHELNRVYAGGWMPDGTTDPLTVNGFRNGMGTIDMASDTGTEPARIQGDLSPGDTVRRDYEERNLMLSRVSNLLTTRSDSFTAYIQVQGWRGVQVGEPELVVQRREAFIADRTPLSQDNRSMTVIRLPTN